MKTLYKNVVYRYNEDGTSEVLRDIDGIYELYSSKYDAMENASAQINGFIDMLNTIRDLGKLIFIEYDAGIKLFYRHYNMDVPLYAVRCYAVTFMDNETIRYRNHTISSYYDNTFVIDRDYKVIGMRAGGGKNALFYAPHMISDFLNWADRVIDEQSKGRNEEV